MSMATTANIMRMVSIPTLIVKEIHVYCPVNKDSHTRSVILAVHSISTSDMFMNMIRGDTRAKEVEFITNLTEVRGKTPRLLKEYIVFGVANWPKAILASVKIIELKIERIQQVQDLSILPISIMTRPLHDIWDMRKFSDQTRKLSPQSAK
jgi:hypothetical protein